MNSYAFLKRSLGCQVWNLYYIYWRYGVIKSHTSDNIDMSGIIYLLGSHLYFL